MLKPFSFKRKENSRSHKRTSWQQGLWAEWIAMLYLILKGWRILHHRYKTPLGEVDVIAEKGNTIAFVEVKFRRRQENLEYVISPYQWKRIEGVAHLMARRFPPHYTFRFDAIFLCFWKWPEHRENAFP